MQYDDPNFWRAGAISTTIVMAVVRQQRRLVTVNGPGWVWAFVLLNGGLVGMVGSLLVAGMAQAFFERAIGGSTDAGSVPGCSISGGAPTGSTVPSRSGGRRRARLSLAGGLAVGGSAAEIPDNHCALAHIFRRCPRTADKALAGRLASRVSHRPPQSG